MTTLTQRKTFVVDTNTLLGSGKEVLKAFPGSELVIPLAVIRELEKKRQDPMLGFVARSVLREIEKLRSQPNCDIKKGVSIGENGGTVRIEVNHIDNGALPDSVKLDHSTDSRILAVALNLQREGHQEVVLISNDLPLRIHADVVGIKAFEFQDNSVQGTYTGVINTFATPGMVDLLHKGHSVRFGIDVTPEDENALTGYNQFTVVSTGAGKGVLCSIEHAKVTKLAHEHKDVFGLRPKNSKQQFALQHLLNDRIGVVSLGGPAGTGKTFLAVAAGLHKVLEEKKFKKVVVFRPLQAVGGEELGYLPGTEEEKMAPWAAAIYDALRNLVEENVYQEVIERKLLEVIPITHIRGRTINDAFIIIDEAQNIERNVLLSILSRLGTGSKAVLSWDAAQKDNLRIGKNDGIVAVVEKLRDEPLFAHVSLQTSVRSEVAQMATRHLDESL